MGGNRHSSPVFGSDYSGMIDFVSLSPVSGSLLGGHGLELTFFNSDYLQEHHLIPELTFQGFDYRCLSEERFAPRSRIVCLHKLPLEIRYTNFFTECFHAIDAAFIGPLPQVLKVVHIAHIRRPNFRLIRTEKALSYLYLSLSPVGIAGGIPSLTEIVTLSLVCSSLSSAVSLNTYVPGIEK
jgi:hypothetical protein